VAQSAVEGLLIENAGAAFAKMFKTWGELGASSLTVRVSLRGPEKMGENVTLTVQLAFAAMVAVLQEARELAKSAGLFPSAEIFEMMNAVIAAGEKEPAFGIEDCEGAKRTPLVVCLRATPRVRSPAGSVSSTGGAV
jgi:hypothetical protein